MAAIADAAGAGTSGPLAALRRQFTAWQIFRSDTGRFWATRADGRHPAAPSAAFAMTVDGDTADDLRKALDGQARDGTG